MVAHQHCAGLLRLADVYSGLFIRVYFLIRSTHAFCRFDLCTHSTHAQTRACAWCGLLRTYAENTSEKDGPALAHPVQHHLWQDSVAAAVLSPQLIPHTRCQCPNLPIGCVVWCGVVPTMQDAKTRTVVMSFAVACSQFGMLGTAAAPPGSKYGTPSPRACLEARRTTHVYTLIAWPDTLTRNNGRRAHATMPVGTHIAEHQ